MANFNFKNLYLINPCKLDDECYARAKHASYILDESTIYKNFKTSIKNLDYLVATSSIDTESDKKHLRNPIYLKDFSKSIYDIKGKIGLVFGREDYGLYNDEIALCDIMLRVPTSDKYPSLNLSHAVNLVLYNIFESKDFKPREKKIASGFEKEKLHSYFSKVLDKVDYADHKKDKTRVMFRRITGRAIISKWEYHTLMGVFSKILKKIKSDKK